MVNQSPVFIVGFPRSGTTYLQSLLSTQNDFWSLPETHFFTDIVNFSKNNGRSEINYIKSQVEKWLGISVHENIVEEYLKGKDSKFLFESIVTQYNNQISRFNINEKRLIEKTPYHFMYVDDLVGMYPEAKVIGIVRSPLDVIDSYAENLKEYFTSYIDTARKLRRCYEILGNLSNEENFLLIRYEDLLNNTIEVLKQICEFLAFELDISSLSEYKSRAKDQKMSFEPWKNKNERDLTPERKKYKVSFKDQIKIQLILSNQMRQYNYSLKRKFLDKWVLKLYSSISGGRYLDNR